MIIIDTNVLSEIMRPHPNMTVVKWLDSLRQREVGVTSVTVGEILYGIGLLPEGKRQKRLIQAATSTFDEDFAGRIFSFDGHAAVEYADIVIRRERAGRPISMPDAQIAAICRVNRCGLATRNIKDFEGTGVDLIDPFEPSR